MTGRKYDLKDRLISFGVRIIKTAEGLPDSFAGKHLAGQLIRSGTAPALHYGEATAAESRSEFIHKMKIALKELREINNCMKMIHQLEWMKDESIMPEL